jgi:hypothetical protein
MYGYTFRSDCELLVVQECVSHCIFGSLWGIEIDKGGPQAKIFKDFIK